MKIAIFETPTSFIADFCTRYGIDVGTGVVMRLEIDADVQEYEQVVVVTAHIILGTPAPLPE